MKYYVFRSRKIPTTGWHYSVNVGPLPSEPSLTQASPTPLPGYIPWGAGGQHQCWDCAPDQLAMSLHWCRPVHLKEIHARFYYAARGHARPYICFGFLTVVPLSLRFLLHPSFPLSASLPIEVLVPVGNNLLDSELHGIFTRPMHLPFIITIYICEVSPCLKW